MARNGAGTYSLPLAGVIPNATILAAWANTSLDDVAASLTNSLAKNGETNPTANLPMNGFKHTGLAAGTGATDSAHLGQVQAAAYVWCGTAGGTANALTLSPSPAIAAYAAGQIFRALILATNTGATTIAVSGLAAKAVTRLATRALAGGELKIGTVCDFIYDGTQFQITNKESDLGSFFVLSSVTPVVSGFGGSSTFNSMASYGNATEQYDVAAKVASWRITPNAGGATQYWRIRINFTLTHATTFPDGVVLQVALTRFNSVNVAQNRKIVFMAANGVATSVTYGSGEATFDITSDTDYISIETLMSSAGNYNVFQLDFAGERIS